MKMQPLIEKVYNKVLDRWPVKIVCVVIALLLYFFYNISQLETRTFSVEVSVVSNGQMMPVSSFQRHVRVKVRSNPQALNTITANDITAVVNINPYTSSGEYNIPITLDFEPEVLLIDPFEVRVTPDTIPIRLEDKTFEYRDIKVSFADQVPHGYEVSSYSVSPTSLRVTGSRSAVEQTTELLTNRLPLANHTKSFTAPVSVTSVNSLISVENDGEVYVTVEIQPINQVIEYPNIPITFLYLPQNFDNTPNISSVSFKGSGDLLRMETISSNAYVVQADCSEITEEGEYDIPLKYIAPSGVVIAERSAENVKLTVSLKNVELDGN